MSTCRFEFLVFEEAGVWFAQGLEYDIFAEALSLAELKIEMREVVSLHIDIMSNRGRPPFVDLPSAPERFLRAAERLRGLPLQERAFIYDALTPASAPERLLRAHESIFPSNRIWRSSAAL